MKKGRGWFCHWLQHCHSDWLACQPSDTNVCFKASGDTSGLSGSFFRGCLTSVYYTDSHVLIFLPLRPSLFLFLGLPALASVCVYTLCVAYFWVSVYERCRQRHVVSQLYLGPASCQRINKNKISTRRLLIRHRISVRVWTSCNPSSASGNSFHGANCWNCFADIVFEVQESLAWEHNKHKVVRDLYRSVLSFVRSISAPSLEHLTADVEH